MAEDREEVSGPRRRRFATTRWTLVLAAADSGDPGADDALASLCEIYWPPVYSYVRHRGESEEDAQDLTQEFFLRVMEKSYLRAANPERGRFRSFLLAAVKNFMSNEWDRRTAKKRGGGRLVIPLEVESEENAYRIEPRYDRTPEAVYEKRWALTVLERVLGLLAEEMRSSPLGHRFERLRPFLLEGGSGASYREVAAELGMTESAVRVAIHRMRKRFGLLLREQVAQTVEDPGAIDDEIRYLLSVVQD